MTVKHRSRVVAVDRKPRIEQFLLRLTGPERERHADGFLCAGAQRQRKPNEQRATGFQQIAPREFDRARFVAHFATSREARRMALRMRGYVPQRHKCPFIAVRISSSLGRGLCARSSAALIVMPL